MGYVGGAEGGCEDGMKGGKRGIIKNNISRTRTDSEAMRGRGTGKKLREGKAGHIVGN